MAACPTVATDPQYAGPMPLGQAHRYNSDTRDAGFDRRRDVLSGGSGPWRCHFAGECSQVGPKGVDPAKAIQLMKRELVSDLLRLRRRRPPAAVAETPHGTPREGIAAPPARTVTEAGGTWPLPQASVTVRAGGAAIPSRGASGADRDRGLRERPRPTGLGHGPRRRRRDSLARRAVGRLGDGGRRPATAQPQQVGYQLPLHELDRLGGVHALGAHLRALAREMAAPWPAPTREHVAPPVEAGIARVAVVAVRLAQGHRAGVLRVGRHRGAGGHAAPALDAV